MKVNSSVRLMLWCPIACALLCCQAQAQFYSLAGDWSDVNNPNGAWTIEKSPGVRFDVSQPDWYSNGSSQPAWADTPFEEFSHVPMWAKAIGDVGALSGQNIYDGFVDAGTVFMHSAETLRTGTDFSRLVWTSPRAGTIQIDGGVWVAKAFDRPQTWQLSKNGAVFSFGNMSQADPYSKTNPFSFSLGTGGPAALDLSVAQHEQIELLIFKTDANLFAPGTFVAVDLSITLVPEPATLALATGIAIFALAVRRGRR